MMDELPTVIGSGKNNELQIMPTKEEVHKAIMGLNINSASESDEMIIAFYQDT